MLRHVPNFKCDAGSRPVFRRFTVEPAFYRRRSNCKKFSDIFATGIGGLRAKVKRWQENAKQTGSEDAIGEVTNYRIRRYYKFPATTSKG